MWQKNRVGGATGAGRPSVGPKALEPLSCGGLRMDGTPLLAGSRAGPFVAAGCENDMELWREVRALGYPRPGKSSASLAATAPKRSGEDDALPLAQGDATPIGRPTSPLVAQAFGLGSGKAGRSAQRRGGCGRCPGRCRDAETQTVAGLARRFTALVRTACQTTESDHAAAGLEAWLTEAGSCGITAVQTVAAGLEQDGAAVRAAFTLPWSSGQAEGQINRLKRLKRQMYGRASLDLLRRRTLLAA